MWKIFIADDEPKIRDGLKTMVSAMGLSVCGEARNGLLALEGITETQPDIALVDINMPRLGGLELIKNISDAAIDCKIIIITGYDKFEYAQQAIRLGVSSYLLKPVLDSQLREAIFSAARELGYKRSSNHYILLARKQLGLHLPYLRECFFRDWCGGALSRQEILEQLELFDVAFPESAALLAATGSEGSIPVQSSAMSDYIAEYTLKNIVEECVQRHSGPSHIFSSAGGNIFALFCDSGRKSGTILEDIRSLVRENLGTKPIVFCGECSLETLEDTYSELTERLRSLSACRPVVMQARQYLCEHFMETELELTRVAESIGINASYLSRLMKSELGMSFKDFLSNLRINRAIELMRSHDLSLSDISDQVGYSTQHYFSTAFKNVLGVSPSEYRRGMQ